MSQLVTGEAVALDLRPAALPSRLLAALLDGLIQLVLLAIVGAFSLAVSFGVSDAASDALSIVLLVVVLIVYPVTFETLMRGRTPGKAAMGLRVVRDDGGPIGFRQALVRGLSGAFLERPGISLGVLAVASSLLNDQHKRIGDLLAGTVVLRERVSAQAGMVAGMPGPLVPWATGLDLSRLTDGLALSVRQFVARADQLSPTAREDLGGRLVQAVTEAVGPPPHGTPGWAVLHAVLAERRRREAHRYGPDSGYPTAIYAPAAAVQGQTGYGPPVSQAAPGYGPPGYGPPVQQAPPAEPPARYVPPPQEPERSPSSSGGFSAPG